MKTPRILMTLATVAVWAVGYLMGRSTSVPATASALRGSDPGIASNEVTKSATKAGPAAVTGDDLVSRNQKMGQRMTAALLETDLITRTNLVTGILREMTEANQPSISEALERRFREGARTTEEGVLIQFREGQVLGSRSMNALPQEPNGIVSWPQRNKMRGWASAAPDEARTFLSTLEPGAVRDSLQREWLDGLAVATPALFAKEFPALEPQQQQKLLPKYLEGIHSSEGNEGLQRWFQQESQKPDHGLAQSAITALSIKLSQNPHQVRAALDFLQGDAAAFATVESIKTVNFRLAATHVGECLELANTLAQKNPVIRKNQAVILADIVDQCSSVSLNTLGNWLNQHKDFPLHDQTVALFANKTHRDDPEAARSWINTIKDPAMREQALQTLERK